MQFNEKLKELRAKKGVSQSELAESIYVSRSAVAKWENGLGLPSNESLRLLCEYFEVSKEELYSDAPTEKVIVQKNQIISRSRKLLVIISTVCAVAITAIIVLAVVLGLRLTASSHADDIYLPSMTVRGSLYEGANYDYDNKNWTVSRQQWKYISGKSEAAPANEIPQVLYNLTVGEEYVLSVSPSPSGYNGHAFGLYSDYVVLKCDNEIFELFLGGPEPQSGGRIDYVFKVKKPCSIELIFLYYGKEVTENTMPAFLFIINAVLPSEGNV